MDILDLINEAIHNAMIRMNRNVGLEISEDVTPVYFVIEDDGEVVEEFYDVYQAISYINQMEL